MNIKTYQDAIDEVRKWLNRDDSDTVDAIPTFIKNAELDISRLVQFEEDITTEELVVVNGSVDIPDNLDALIEVYSEDGETGTEVSHRELLRQRKYPKYRDGFIFSNVNKKYLFENIEDGTEVFIRYYKKIEHLSFANSKNTILELAPDLLVYTALFHGATFAEDNEKAPIWDAKSQNALAEVKTQIEKRDMTGSPLVIPPRFNYYYAQ